MENQNLKIVRSVTSNNDLGFTREQRPNITYASNIEVKVVNGKEIYFFGNGNRAQAYFVPWSSLTAKERDFYCGELESSVNELVNFNGKLLPKHKLEEL